MSNRRLVVGHTGILWMKHEDVEGGIKIISENGFNYIELFAWTLKTFHDEGRKEICKEYNIPLISSYYSIDIVDPAKRAEEMAKLSEWTDIITGMGGKFATFGGNSVPRKGFNFNEHKKYTVDFVNEAAKIMQGKGMQLNFHPHTGTPVETEEEIRSFMDAIDTKYVGFAPDIGQIQKGGADPVQITKDYLSIIKLVHFKDYCGKVKFDDEGKEIDQSGFVCYSPLGQGVVDLAGILDILENYKDFNGPIMVELDGTDHQPISSEEAVKINRAYLENLGYSFVKR